jgi:uncharacterized protein (TIGR02246 family)
MTDNPSSFEATMVELVAKEEIRRLIQDYRRFLDARDLVAYSQLFADDGVWTGLFGEARGPQAIQTMLEQSLEPNPPAPGKTTRHVVPDSVIDVDGDRATAISTWLLVERGETDMPVVSRVGSYTDEFVKERGRWRFLRRDVHRHIPAREEG